MMKKITFLFFLLVTAFGYSQTLPFDFNNPNQEFTPVGNAVSIIPEPGNESNNVLQIIGPAAQWDNAEIAFAAPVDLSIGTSNSISFRFKADAEYGTRKHLMKFIGGTAGGTDIELFFELDAGTAWQTISLDADDAPQFNGAAANFEKMLLFTDAGDGNTGTYYFDDISAPEAAPETCSDNIKNQDETDVDCGGTFCAPCDVTAPTGFTAAKGTIGAFSVELLLNATDASGTITYDISYNGGANTTQTTGASGVETPFVINGLTPETLYSFEVSASDASGNQAANNPIAVEATTLADPSTPCDGFSTETREGSFSTGFNYTIETLPSGTEVKYTIEILDTDKPGLCCGQLHAIGPDVYINMTNTGQTFVGTVTGLSNGQVISYAGRFPYAAGGLVETKLLEYTVGDDCGTLGTEDFNADSFSLFPNPTQDSWTLKTKIENIASINVFDILGKSVLSLSPNTSEATIDGSNLKSGLYFAQVKTANGISTLKLVKK
ncbi:hypothetical protein GCM10023314_13990 [Algibacter agarivorans]|uniref:Fibronectin type-III domain-containing protein n=1 Tax=Algibacter agarivorans TaxID=1109741 RepID=A0ABP9GGU2_9FLAO